MLLYFSSLKSHLETERLRKKGKGRRQASKGVTYTTLTNQEEMVKM